MAVADMHPDIADLQAFTLGTLDDASLADIESHVADCPTCQERAAGASGDTLVELLRRVHAQSAHRSDTVTEVAAQAPTPAPVSVLTEGLALPPSADGADAVDMIPPELARHERYRVRRLLGAGGMGSVYEAEHRVMQRAVAVKVINRAFTTSPAAVERFRREVRAAAMLSHPNIVGTHDAEDAGNSLFLVMEYVEGISLARLVKEGGPLPVAQACDYIRQAALGLQHAHERGMVHRDIKPDNLMLVASPVASTQGVVKVLDFGLASLTAERGSGLTEAKIIEGLPQRGSGLTDANVVMGTPDYMAPEQAEDARNADIRADVYSLGCTLYYLLTGSVPYPAETSLLKIRAHRERPLPPLRKACPAAPPKLAAVVTRLLAKQPEDRYQTPAEVAAALEPFTQTSKPGDKKRGRKHGRQLAAAALFAGLIAAASVVFYIATDNGTIEIRTDDENIKIIAEHNGKQVTVLDPGSKQSWVVDTGEWTVRLDGNPDGFRLEMPNTFKLKRGDRQIVTVRRLKGAEADRAAFLKADKELIQGTWNAVSAEVFGKPLPAEIIGAVRPSLTFAGEKVTWKANPSAPFAELIEGMGDKSPFPKGAASLLSRPVEGIYHLDPTKTPKAIDFVYFGPNRKVLLGIYTLEGDTLKLCLSIDPEHADERPTEFATKEGVLRPLVILKRQVPEKVGEVHRFSWDIGDLKVAKPEDKEDVKSTPPPAGAVILFDGKSVERWEKRGGGKATWKLLPDGIMEVHGGDIITKDKHGCDIVTKEKFDGKFKLHVEFRVPYMPQASGQDRGNSGVYLQGRYEVQILDSYCLRSGYKDCGALYGLFAPSVNVCKAPTIWQSYDIEFTAPVCMDGKKVELGRMTVHQNGVRIHDNVKIITDNTREGMGGDPCTPGPILLQDLGAPVQFRNIWLLRSGDKVGERHQIKWAAGQRFCSVDVSPDGRCFLASRNNPNAVRVWDQRSGKLLHELDGYIGRFTPNGQQVITVGDSDSTFRVCNLDGGKVARTFKGKGPVHNFWVCGDGSRVLSVIADTLTVWDVDRGELLAEFPMQKGTQLLLTHDGKSLLAQAGGKPPLMVHDAVLLNQDGTSFSQLRQVDRLLGMSANGRRLACLEGQTLQVHDVASGKGVAAFDVGVNGYGQLSGDGRRLLASSTDRMEVRLWDVDTKKSLLTMPVKQAVIPGESRMAISADGRYAIVGGTDLLTVFRLPDAPAAKDKP